MFYTKCFTLLLSIFLFSCTNNAPTTGSSDEKKLTSPEKNASIKTELALYQKALLMLNTNKLDEANKLFTEMSQLQPDIAGPWANLALIQMKKGNAKASKKLIDIALQKNPNMPQALNIAGSLSLSSGQLNEAKKYFTQAITHKPDYALAHYNLALLFDVYFQDLPKAITHYQHYLDHLDQEDKETTRWLKGLKSTVGASS